jgi:hypothetical protein
MDVDMNLSESRFKIFFTALAILIAALSCGDSDDTPLGSEFIGDLLGSRPGEVFEDTIAMAGGDTSYAFFTTIGRQGYMEVGLDLQYQRTTMIRGDFSSANATLTVQQADLRIHAIPDNPVVPPRYLDNIDAVFYNLATPYHEDSTRVTLDTTSAIPDPDNGGAIDRTIRLGFIPYALPPDLVQDWIQSDSDSINNGMAILYPKSLDELFGIYTREASDTLRPTIQVRFEGQAQASNFPIVADGTFVRPTATTNNLIISDGFVRRIHLPVDLTAIDDSAAVHDARLVLTYVPGTVFGTNQDVLLYLPKSADPRSPEFSEPAQLIDKETLAVSSGTLELQITNVLLLILSGALENNGFVLRFTTEDIEVRQAEFYPSSNDSLGPRFRITYSTPADFEE